MSWLWTLEPMWFWLIGGLILLSFELIIPGVFLLWLGLAALITGLITALFGFGWEFQAIVFILLSLVLVYFGYRWQKQYKSDFDTETSHRFDGYIGLETELTEALMAGRGRIRVGETSWRVSGPDLPLGTRVKVVSVDQGELTVEKVADTETSPSDAEETKPREEEAEPKAEEAKPEAKQATKSDQ